MKKMAMTGWNMVAKADPAVAQVPHLRRRAERDEAFSHATAVAMKRGLDLLLLVPVALFALPLVAMGSLAVIVTSPGNPFYFQHREGRYGKRIRVWKLRTMHKDAESLLEEYLAEHPEARAEWLRTYKLRHDPRILPVIGAVLRRSSLDELPQLWNVARGDMSFVGPRPLPDYHLAAFGEEFLTLRRTVPPGLTGWWQIGTRSEGSAEALEALDRYYIVNWSMWLDLSIIARTPRAVLSRKGAY